MRFRIGLLLGVISAALWISAEGLGVRSYRVPLVDGKMHTRDVLQQVLEAGGSDVRLPENFPDRKIPVYRGATRLSLMAWNAVMDDFGIRLSLGEEAVRVEVDLATLEANLNEFEEHFVELFGIEREAELHHLSAPDCEGPVVVFLHGLDSGKRVFKGVCAFLVDKGFDLYFFEYPNDDRVARNAARLSRALKGLPEERGRDVSLVTHSMGGVIAQYMLETPELDVPGVRRFIACAPPFQGSELAALRGFVEVGDQTMKVLLDPAHGFDFFGDGMGRAGIDLQPESLLMEELRMKERNPRVAYSIVAGNKGVLPPEMLRTFKAQLEKETSEHGMTEALRRITLERIGVMLSYQSGEGDGAVTLESATLEGVDDRVVLPLHHLEFLSGLRAGEDIGALREVLKRLPKPE